MSKIGKKPITLPNNIEIKKIKNHLLIKGKLGSFTVPIDYFVIRSGKLYLYNENRTLWGTQRSIIANKLDGITQGFTKRLKLVGIGYRAQVEGNKLIMKLGYANFIEYDIPKDVHITCTNKTLLIVFGADKQRVNEVSAKIQELKKPDAYKGKGIRIESQILTLKQKTK